MTDEERVVLSRMRFGGRRKRQAFFEVPQRVNLNSDNDLVSQSVIAWSFYPKLLVRDVPGSKALRNVGNNQPVSTHTSSVNKGHNELRWLSYYRIMQTSSAYHAHETTAVEALPVALLCGDVRCDVSRPFVLSAPSSHLAFVRFQAANIATLCRCSRGGAAGGAAARGGPARAGGPGGE